MKKKYVNEAGLMLITIFAMAVNFGLMAEREQSVSHTVRQVNPSSPIRSPRIRGPDSEVVVAIIDTGIDMTHPDLSQHEWQNLGEMGFDKNGKNKANNRIDDDLNGFIDDISGFDFVENRAQILDQHGHGTHIAGIVLKSAQPILAQIKFMNLKYFDRGIDGSMALSNSLKALRYAIKMKADIINYSGGGTVANSDELNLLREASRQGVLIVAAAGNESMNSELQPFYPANYRLPNILSVTAMSEFQGDVEILPTSNYGIRSVAVAAQGKNIDSTLPGGRYGLMTGTSQATAFATATAVQMIAAARRENRRLAPEEIIERIVTSGRTSQSLVGRTRLGSALAMDRAVRFQSQQIGSLRKKMDMIEAFERELSRPQTAAITPKFPCDESAVQLRSVCVLIQNRSTIDPNEIQ